MRASKRAAKAAREKARAAKAAQMQLVLAAPAAVVPMRRIVSSAAQVVPMRRTIPIPPPLPRPVQAPAKKRQLVARGPAPVARSLVFSFGSNLCTAQLWDRCPDATIVGSAVLEGHRLAFVGHSGLWGGAVATVRPAAKAEVLGELMLLTDADLARLDGFEGAPHVYRRERVQVRTHSASGEGREVTAWTYTRDGEEAPPSLTYVARIATGYGRLGYHDADIVRAIRAAERAQERRWRAFNAAVEPRRPALVRDESPRMTDFFSEIDRDMGLRPDREDEEWDDNDLSDIPPAWLDAAERKRLLGKKKVS